jgi:DNA-binding transcriptional LysR family regulator
MDIDLRRLRYFVMVAEELSFVRAASLLYITQPALSRQVRFLEDDLGVSLFTRDRRGTALTPAGAALLNDARPLLAASVAMQRRVRTATRDNAHFTIGFMPGVDAAPIIREFTAAAAHLTIDVVYTSITDQVEYVMDGRVDVCFVRLPLATESLTIVPLFPEPRVAALPHTHELADAVGVTIDQLQSFPLLQDPAEVPEWRGTTLHDAVPRAHDRSGPRSPTLEECLARVATGAGFAVIPAGLAAHFRYAEVRYVALDGVAPRMVALASSPQRAMPELDQFADLAREMLGGRPEGPSDVSSSSGLRDES